MGQECFICKKELGKLAMKLKISDLQYKKIPIPDGMTDEDRVCKKCYQNEIKKSKELSKQLKEQASRENKQKGGFSMKTTYLAIIVVIVVGVVFAAIMYQPYGECSALFDKIEENQELRESLLEKIESGKLTKAGELGTMVVIAKLLEVHDENVQEWKISCRPLM